MPLSSRRRSPLRSGCTGPSSLSSWNDKSCLLLRSWRSNETRGEQQFWYMTMLRLRSGGGSKLYFCLFKATMNKITLIHLEMFKTTCAVSLNKPIMKDTEDKWIHVQLVTDWYLIPYCPILLCTCIYKSESVTTIIHWTLLNILFSLVWFKSFWYLY